MLPQKKKIYLNEFNILLDNTAYLPYASGLLQAYAQTKPLIDENYEFMPIIYAPDIPEKIIAFYDNPSVAAFSVAVWNEQLCLSVARRMKKIFPRCLIVFGGPSVPFDPSDYFVKYEFIDVAVRGEGERAFAQVLERFLESKDFKSIGGVSYRDPKTGLCIRNADEQPVIEDKNLDIFPSPYLEGVFDVFMGTGLNWQAILETNRGCPFTCTYCFWGQGGLSRRMSFFGLERIRQEIEWCGKNKIAYVFCADGNFGMFERDLQVANMLVETKKEYGFPDKFRVNYAKTTDDRVINAATTLHKHKLEKAITMSLQSYSEQALRNVKRKNIKTSTFRRLQVKFKAEDVNTYTELILALPGETYRSWVDGLELCLQSSIKNDIFVYLLQVYPNTELADVGYQKKYGIKTVRIPLNEGHAAVRSPDIPTEYEDVVVETNSMPLEEWKKAAVVSWLVQSFVGLKLAYFVLLYLVDRYAIKYTDLIEYISKVKEKSYGGGTITDSVLQLYDLASLIASGNARTTVLTKFGDIYWEPEEAFYLCIANKREEFFGQLYELVIEFLNSRGFDCYDEQLKEVIKYQKARVPQYFSFIPKEFLFNYNIPQYFEEYFFG